jgi:hypothetical protein
MTLLVETALETDSRVDSWKLISWKPFHILVFLFSISWSHLYRRVVPCINYVCKQKGTFDNLNTDHFVQLCANKNQREISTPLLLCLPLRRLQKRPRHRHPIRAPGPLIPGCVGWFLWECGWANPWFKLPYRDGGWLLVRVVRLH